MAGTRVGWYLDLYDPSLCSFTNEDRDSARRLSSSGISQVLCYSQTTFSQEIPTAEKLAKIRTSA
jgi:hypothetical protein